MTIRVRAGDLVIEVDSGHELQEVMLALGSTDMKKASGPNLKRFSGTVKLASHHSLSQLFSSLGSTNKANILMALKENPAGMTDEELRARIHLENNNALAGVLGAISKNATKAGFTFSQIITKSEEKDKEGKRLYRYQLTKEMAEAMP